jgi:hypothetical protein
MKTKYFVLALAAIGMVACSEKDEAPQNNPQAGMNADKGYIALNLKSTDDITRAEFEDGSADEQAITEATFYFFDAAGNTFNINANGNYYNVAVADNGGTEAPNIESMTDPVLVVEKYKGQFPAKIAAVVNYKGTLQQIVQNSKGDKLDYVLVKETGPDHDKTFEVQVRLNSNVIGKGEGHSKKQAEQKAARQALELMGQPV